MTEEKYIVDRPTRIKSCLRCWQPLKFKNNKLYCPTCDKYRTAKTSHWIDHVTRIQLVSKIEIHRIIKTDDEPRKEK